MWKRFLYDFKNISIGRSTWFDISKYAIKNSKKEVKDRIKYGCASKLPWKKTFLT